MLEILRMPALIGSCRDETGATATEYAILVGLMVFAMVAGATVFGIALDDAFVDLTATVSTFADRL